MSPEIPSSCRRFSAWCRRSSTRRSPALSWLTSSATSSHSGVAYSGWNPVSRYSLARFSRNTLAFTGARDHSLEEVASDVVGGQAALAVEHAGQAVLVLETEDPALHGDGSRSRFVSTVSNGQ